MKKFVDKLIGRLEEIKTYYAEDFSQGYSCEVDCVEKYEVKKIVNQLAEEYINTSTDTSEDYRSTLERYYEKGLNDAWELARKIFTFNDNKIKEIFGVAGKRSAFDDLSPQEALAKLEAYEKANEIKVGDVVQYQDNKIVVTRMTTNKELVYGFDEEGYDFCYSVEGVIKTGKHIDIQSILEQIKE